MSLSNKSFRFSGLASDHCVLNGFQLFKNGKNPDWLSFTFLLKGGFIFSWQKWYFKKCFQPITFHANLKSAAEAVFIALGKFEDPDQIISIVFLLWLLGIRYKAILPGVMLQAFINSISLCPGGA